jgi:glycosyltransferase involved in cell wall biosynthesis
MKICVDAQSAIAQHAGVGRYTRILVEYLDRRESEHELSLCYFDFRRRARAIPVQKATTKVVRWCPGALAEQAWKRVNFPPYEWFAGKADLFHFPNFTMPPLHSGKSIVTIHDMSFARYPQFAEEKNLRNLNARIPDTAARADAIITISNFSAGEIESLLHVPREKIHPIPLGISQDFARASDADIAAAQKRLGLTRPYLLFVGTIEPRKNISFLVDVFDQLTDFDGDLVLVGRPGWKSEATMARIAASPHRDRIRLLDSVGDADLSAVYSGAALFVIPSHYEGFGFPPLEAMACGTPVVSSTGGSLPEVLGSAACIVEGFEAPDWCESISALLSDSTRRGQLVEAGYARARSFQWDTTAEQTWALYEKVLGS